MGSTTDLRANGDNTGASMGVIDEADFAVWKTHFGETGGAGSGAAANATLSAVPEPASWLLIVVGTAWLVALRRGAATPGRA